MPGFTTVTENLSTPEETFAFVVTLSNWPTFRGFGPLPGIVSASVPDGTVVGLGARVRVTNTDGSVHHERVTTFDPPRRYAVRMELGPPASRVLASIDEDVELQAVAGGTRVHRRFVVRPRSWLTSPLAWLVTHAFLRPAVRRHDRAVAAALSARG
jgi:hypothetical protein